MIQAPNLDTISQQAHADAKAFLTQPEVSSKKFCDISLAADEKARIPSLALFVANLTGATIQNFKTLPAPNYGSWLFASSDDNASIYLDQRQMQAWFQQTGMPLDIQQIRSILHELGHLQINLRLMQGASGTFVDPSYPQEEEMAWVYAMLFSGLILGDYALSTRQSPHNCDDAPKVRL